MKLATAAAWCVSDTPAAFSGSRLLHRVSPLRRVAPSHSRLGARRAESACRAAWWQLLWIRLKWLTAIQACAGPALCHQHITSIQPHQCNFINKPSIHPHLLLLQQHSLVSTTSSTQHELNLGNPTSAMQPCQHTLVNTPRQHKLVNAAFLTPPCQHKLIETTLSTQLSNATSAMQP